ncbi:MAG: hypothetical protein GY898_28710 [Proteobacteria bacterium]|nr:hypothetical protein [Pseudomonadota bacterium]
MLAVGCLPDEPPGGPVPTETLTLTAGETLDLIDGAGTADAWDIVFDGRDLFLNGGESGDGRAGGIDMRLLDLELPFEDLNRKNQILYFFFYDSNASALSDWWWYGLDGTHTLFSNFHVYFVRRDGREFAVQILDYYRVIDGSAEAGYPEFRWTEVGTDATFVEDIDATAGGLGADASDPANKWTYFSFDGGVVDLTDEEALDSDAWDLGFKRFNIKSNGPPSGPAATETYDFDAARGEDEDDVLGFTAEGQEGWFDDRVDAWDPDGSEEFTQDSIRPVLRQWWTPGDAGEPALVDGRWFLVSDRSGGLVAKLRIIDRASGGSDATFDEVTLEWAVLE